MYSNKKVDRTVTNLKTGVPYKASIYQANEKELSVLILDSENDLKGIFRIPVRKANGFILKINKTSVSTDSGSPYNVMEFFADSENESYRFLLDRMIQHIVFDNTKKQLGVAL